MREAPGRSCRRFRKFFLKQGCTTGKTQYLLCADFYEFMQKTWMWEMGESQVNVCDIHTDDIRFYLCRYQELRNTRELKK